MTISETSSPAREAFDAWCDASKIRRGSAHRAGPLASVPGRLDRQRGAAADRISGRGCRF